MRPKLAVRPSVSLAGNSEILKFFMLGSTVIGSFENCIIHLILNER
jgi:hypothetical protein